MVNIKELLADETLWYMLILGWFIIIGVTVNTQLGLLYYSMTVGAIFLSIFDKDKTIKLDKNGKWLEAVLHAGIIYIGFVIINLFLIPIYQQINIGGIISLLAASAPALSQSKTLNFISFSFPVAFVETMAFIRFFDYLATKLKISIANFNIGSISLIGFFSFIFMFIHTTAKGITNNVALLMTFVLMAVSLSVVVYYREGKQAVLVHMIANFLASLAILGIFVVAQLIMVII